ncbi:MAG: septum formation initiator family protein [Treponema sp.]|jgi:cell division protein FtsB|nr:septum formation initiator family protein [Treponema sp.]
MSAFKYLIALWTAVAVYGLSSVLTGAVGLSAYQQLLADRDRQWANMKSLQLINEELENATNSLLYDRDAIAVYARELGYGRKDERYIRIVGLGGMKNPHTSAGHILRAGKPDFVSDRTLKIISLSAGLAVFALLLIFDMLRDRQERA